ncbi:hypothetical protein SETIT_6G221400v2 [Setaria italica]|uniref:J domain-containing protein n=2 Tax=Setaria italica TaxID=4555 RepID=A0A368RP33_SETIT|nr:hypothetical protein SETIT_6G221400v2 [Setaria italica]
MLCSLPRLLGRLKSRRGIVDNALRLYILARTQGQIAAYLLSVCTPLVHRCRSSCGQASTMVLGSNISIQKTLYEVLSVSEDATYGEIRAAYKSAALNTHPDKGHMTLESSVPSSEQQEFLSVQRAWEILRHPASRADYDKQLQSSRCGDYFSITSCELGDMGILVSGDGEVEQQASDSSSAFVVLGCGSCSLKVRLIINETL